MKITKLGHSCLLVEEKEARILIDPGSSLYSTLQNDVKNLDVVLITQIHGDHFDLESLNKILANNPAVKIYTIREVKDELNKAGIACEILGNNQSIEVRGVKVEGFGEKHAEIYKEQPLAGNTGYMIAERFYHPGDAFYKPGKPVEILALPVAGPWMKISEAIDYAREVKPKVCFPIHDANLKSFGVAHKHPSTYLPPAGIEFTVIETGESKEF